MSKRLSKYIATFHYYDKTLVVLSATSRGISIVAFESVIGGSVGIASASLNLIFSLTSGIKKLLNITKKKKKKHKKIVMLARRKLSSIGTVISQALTDLEISHEEYKTITDEEENYRRLKEKVRMIKNSDKLNSKEDKKWNQ